MYYLVLGGPELKQQQTVLEQLLVPETPEATFDAIRGVLALLQEISRQAFLEHGIDAVLHDPVDLLDAEINGNPAIVVEGLRRVLQVEAQAAAADPLLARDMLHRLVTSTGLGPALHMLRDIRDNPPPAESS